MTIAFAGTVYTAHDDAAGDAVPRLTDPGADGPFDRQAHHLPDIRKISLGKWDPTDPQLDLFAGTYAPSGKFLRLELALDGVMNPPGPTFAEQFDPFAYGPHPVYGFVELDMDQDADTGGELDNPQFRYVGNVVRFGSKPADPALADRIALDGSAFDGDFLTPPFVERSGEEFHLALLGDLFESIDITEVAGDGDTAFEAGETWWIDAAWFHRAHGYEPFSLATGGAQAGEYAPRCTLQFEHVVETDVTWLTLVFPLKNSGAGSIWGEPPEAPNGDPSDQFSVREALFDLQDSAAFVEQFPSGLPEEDIITGWLNKNPSDFLEPVQWVVTVLLGTSYTSPGDGLIWTDVSPDGVRGDVNGDMSVDQQDRLMIQQFIEDLDAIDGVVDGRVELADFALDFSVFDIDHSGVADSWDRRLAGLVTSTKTPRSAKKSTGGAMLLGP